MRLKIQSRNILQKIFDQDQIFLKLDQPFYKPIESDDNCMICYNPLKYNITRLDCGHYLHNSCYSEYINYSPIINNNHSIKCPICNRSISSVDYLIFDDAK